MASPRQIELELGTFTRSNAGSYPFSLDQGGACSLDVPVTVLELGACAEQRAELMATMYPSDHCFALIERRSRFFQSPLPKMKRPECSQRVPFTERVAYLAKDSQRRLVGAACFLEIASLEVQVTQVADGRTFLRPVSRLAMDAERSLEVSMRQIHIPQFEVGTAKAIETHPLREAIAHFAMNEKRTLK